MRKIIFCLLPIATLFGLTTSVIVPCHPAHFPLLENLLECYRAQSRQPDEIVVSLSEAHKVDPAALASLESAAWPFSLKIIADKAKNPPGKNRNIACANATCQLVLCQDADDLPHPQRVEIVHTLFESLELEHLIHLWLPSDGTFEPIDMTKLQGTVSTFRAFGLIDVPKIHNGSVCFLREVFDKVHWKPVVEQIAEDAEFNRIAYAFCKKKAVVRLPLIQYRGQYSTFDLKELDKKYGAPQ